MRTESMNESSDRQSIPAGKITADAWIYIEDDGVLKVHHVEPYTNPATKEHYVLIVCQAGYRIDYRSNDSISLATNEEIAQVSVDEMRTQLADGLTELASYVRTCMIPVYPITVHIDVDSTDDIERIAHQLNLDVHNRWGHDEVAWQYPHPGRASIIVTWSYDR